MNIGYLSDLPAQQVPAYTTANARVAWRLTVQIEMSLAGEDLLQPSLRRLPASQGRPS